VKNNKKPIGIFDSGLGGLTVVKEIIAKLPHENIVYLGDTARVPYGARSKETIIKFSFEDAKFLLRKKVKCIIIACNTSSALAGRELKKKLKIPVFDVINSALNEANKASKNRRIAVIGTRGTIDSGVYKVLYSQACPLFVPFIEEGEIDSPALKSVAKKYLSKFKGKIDTLIMGCTHYPIIKNIIKRQIDGKVKLINPGETSAIEVEKYLSDHDLLNRNKSKGKIQYFVTDVTPRFADMAEMFLGIPMAGKIRKIDL
jgi:glutamate racemase